MPSFDEALLDYQTKRQELRELQGKITKKENEQAQLDKEVVVLKRKYISKRKAVVEAQDILIPELQKEVKANPVFEKNNGG